MVRVVKKSFEFFYFLLLGLGFVGLGVYALIRIWFGNWKDYVNTPSYSVWNWWMDILNNHWLVISTISLTIIVVVGIGCFVFLYFFSKD